MRKYTVILILLCNIWNLTAKAHTEVKTESGDGYVDIWIPIVGDRSSIETLLEDYNVRLTFIPKDDFISKLEFGYNNGILPDLTFVDYKVMELLLINEILEPIEDFVNGIDGIYRSRILSGPMESNSYNSLLYGLPISFETEVLYYNKKLLPTPPLLLTDWVTAGEQLYTESGYSIGTLDIDGDNGSLLFNRYLSQYKTETIDELNSVYVELFTQFLTIYNSNDLQVLNRQTSFERGLVATQIATRDSIRIMKMFFPDLDYGMVTIPVLNEETPTISNISGTNVILNHNSEDIHQTWKVMKYITYQPEGNRVIANYFGQLPTLISITEEFPEYEIFVNQVREKTGSIEFKDYSTVLKEIYEGRLTPEEAANLFAPIP